METAELAASLRSAVGLLHKGLRRQVSTASLYSMTEMETIHHLFRAAALPSELAALTRITTQSMSQILAKLEGNGLIKRTPSKEDGRKVSITLTAAGRKLVETSKDERDAWLRARIEDILNPKEQAVLARALPLLQRLSEA